MLFVLALQANEFDYVTKLVCRILGFEAGSRFTHFCSLFGVTKQLKYLIGEFGVFDLVVLASTPQPLGQHTPKH